MNAGCRGNKKDGSRCNARCLRGGAWCYAHSPDPEVAEGRRRARKAGGRARGQQISRVGRKRNEPDSSPSWWQLDNVAHVRQALAYVVQEVLQGHLAARDANAVTSALNASASIIRETELERRLAELEVATGSDRR